MADLTITPEIKERIVKELELVEEVSELIIATMLQAGFTIQQGYAILKATTNMVYDIAIKGDKSDEDTCIRKYVADYLEARISLYAEMKKNDPTKSL